jgi:hypothetical protein
MLRLIQAPDENETPDLKVPRMRRVDVIAVRFKNGPRRLERLGRPAQVARDKRNLGPRDDAPRTCQGFFWAEGACSSSQEFLCSREIAQLCHRDASKRKRRRIVAQRNSLQCAEGIPCGQRPCCGCDHGIHQNPATLVTPSSFDACISICI